MRRLGYHAVWRVWLLLGVLLFSGCDGGGSIAIGLNIGTGGEPQNVQAYAGSGIVTLTWDEVAGADSYVVFWKTAPGVSSRDNALIGDSSATLTHSNLVNGVTFYYRVASVEGGQVGTLSAEVSATPGEWSTRVVTSNRLTAATWSGSRFVAAGEGGQLFSSDDGLSWSTVSAVTSNNLRGVVWGGSRFVAVGDSGAIIISSDGESWEDKSIALANYLQEVAWNGVRYVAVGQVIGSSSEGIWHTTTPQTASSWSRASSVPGTGLQLNGVAWSGSLFVAVGQGGLILSSSDGDSWTRRASRETADHLRGVVWAEGQFVAVGDSGTILTSSDGLSWSNRISGYTLNLQQVYHDGALYLAVGENGLILSSANGISWRREQFSAFTDLYGVTGNDSVNLSMGGRLGSGILYSRER